MTDPHTDHDDRLAQLLSDALDEYRSRGSLDVAAWQARHPELAGELPALLDTLRNFDTAVEDWSALGPVTPTDPAPVGALTVAPDAASPALPGSIGRYRILEMIGSGGMGTVYKAHDPKLDRVVALKVPRFEGPPRARELAMKRFEREARVAAQVRHPHVCPIHDVDEHEGRPFVVMDFIESRSLADRLAVRGRVEDPREAVALARQVADALDAVHAKGLVHRDLKPGNVLLDGAGRAVLTDFGLARLVQDAEQLTADGALVGTPAYMAPEQASLADGPIGPAADVYSLGVVLYQMLAGRTPFDGTVPKVLYQILHDTPPPPSRFRGGLDPALEAVVLKALARRPEDRYPTARAFAEALERWTAGTTTETDRPVPESAVAGKPSGQVVRADLPGVGTVTLALEPGAAVPKNVSVTVREQEGKKRKGRRLAVTVSVTFALLLLAVGTYLVARPRSLEGLYERVEPRYAFLTPASDSEHPPLAVPGPPEDYRDRLIKDNIPVPAPPDPPDPPPLRVAAAKAANPRALWLKSFNELTQNAQVNLKDVERSQVVLENGNVQSFFARDLPVLARINPVKVVTEQDAAQEARLMLKVWAVPVRDGKETAEKVNLAEHRWEPGESFYLYYEAAVPVQLGLYEGEPGQASRVLLPNVAYPESLGTAMPGEPRKLSTPIQVGPNPEDQNLTLVAVQTGARQEMVLMQTARDKKDAVKQAEEYVVRLNAVAEETRRRDRKLSVLPGGKAASANPDEVAMLASGAQPFGYLPLRVQKKPK